MRRNSCGDAATWDAEPAIYAPRQQWAAQHASLVGAHAVALTGRDGGELGKAASLHINVPEQHMGRIEDAHLAICHMLAFSFIDAEG